jgi:hypothetical protein
MKEISQTAVEGRPRTFARIFLIVAGSFTVIWFVEQRVTVGLVHPLLNPPIVPALVVYILFCLWIGSLIAKMAWKKGRSWNAFFILSLVFPLLAWIIAAVVSTDLATVTSGTKKCHRCAELIKSEATLCKHCGSEAFSPEI